MEKTFIRVRSIKDIVIFASLIIAGGILIAIPTGAGVNIAGFFMIFAGIILSIILRTGYKDTETGERFQKKEHYFQQALMPSILQVIESNPGAIDMTQAEKGNGLKLDIYYSAKSGKAYIQLFEYVPYKYEPASKMYEHAVSRIATLIK